MEFGCFTGRLWSRYTNSRTRGASSNSKYRVYGDPLGAKLAELQNVPGNKDHGRESQDVSPSHMSRAVAEPRLRAQSRHVVPASVYIARSRNPGLRSTNISKLLGRVLGRTIARWPKAVLFFAKRPEPPTANLLALAWMISSSLRTTLYSQEPRKMGVEELALLLFYHLSVL